MYHPCLEEVDMEKYKTDEHDDIATEAGRTMFISP